jgi:hypothetical protein
MDHRLDETLEASSYLAISIDNEAANFYDLLLEEGALFGPTSRFQVKNKKLHTT